MNITQNVILDLLPLYEAGEVSDDTRALVAEFLAQHPDFVRSGRSADAMLKTAAPARPEQEGKAALARTQALLSRRHWSFGVALACTLAMFSFSFEGSRLTWFMWRDARPVALVLMGFAIGSWIGYIRANRQLRVAGM